MVRLDALAGHAIRGDAHDDARRAVY